MQPKRRQRQRNYEDNEEDNVNDNDKDKGNDNDKDKDEVLDTCLAHRGATQKKGPDTKTCQCVCVSRNRKYSLLKNVPETHQSFLCVEGKTVQQ